MVLLLSAVTVLGQETTIIPGSTLPGQKAHLGNPKQVFLVVEDRGLDLPVTLPPGRVRVDAWLRLNTRAELFTRMPVVMWTGPMTVRSATNESLAGRPLSMSFVSRRPGPSVLRLAWELSNEAQLKRRDLRQEAESKDARPSDLSWMDDKKDTARELLDDVNRDLVIDATATPVPMLLLERIEIVPLPRPTNVPEIANVVPYFRVNSPSIILGENFDLEGLEIWSWRPPADVQEIEAGLADLTEGRVSDLPATPPAGAKKAELLDQDTQVVMAELPGDVLWLKNKNGWSKPYLGNAARPYWISVETVEQGGGLYLYGYALRMEEGGDCRGTLVGGGKALELERIPGKDRYLAEFRVPRDAAAGKYDLYVHSGAAGRFGWAKVGGVTVTAVAPAPKVFNVTDYGADGTDLASDRGAIVKAMAAATKAGGGVVQFPPGSYRTERTLEVPDRVILRGESRETTVIEGFGYDRADRTVSPEYGEMSFQAVTLMVLKSGSGLQNLVVRGVPAEGVRLFPYYPLVLASGVRGVRIEQCKLWGPAEDREKDVTLNGTALYADEASHLRVADNEIVGQIQLERCDRLDLLRNRIRQATVELLSVELTSCRNILVDSNTILDGAGRLCPIVGCAHGYFRNNRILYKFRADIASGEGFLAHGDIPHSSRNGWARELLGSTTAATETTLTDKAWRLQPGTHKGFTVVITAGRGFGQYRVVADNTADTLTVERPWAVIPDETSRYNVRFMFTENAWYGNENVGHSVSAWYDDQLGCVWEQHRDAFNSAYLFGGDVLGKTDRGVPIETGHPGVSSFNLFYQCRFEASRFNLEGIQQFEPVQLHAPLFANSVVDCDFSRPLLSRDCLVAGATPEMQLPACVTMSFLNKYGLPISGPTDRGEVWPAMSHTVLKGNRFSQAPLGVRMGAMVRKTFLLDNVFRDITYHPWQDGGAETVYRGNQRVTTDTNGKAMTRPIPDGRNARVIPLPPDVKVQAVKKK